jgi:hypothetical protein
MATGRSVNFRARLLPLAGAAIVVVLALGHDAALDRTPVRDPSPAAGETYRRIGVSAYRRIVLDCSFITCRPRCRMTVLVPTGSVSLFIWTRNTPSSKSLEQFKDRIILWPISSLEA